MPQAPATLVEALKASFGGSLRTPDGAAEPAALLWTDPAGQWKSLIPTLTQTVPELCALGDYKPAERQGPVIWLKCIVDRTLPDVSPPPGVVPILYLPRVGRQDLRAGGDCPRALRPLVELQYRGAVWHQRNGRDWTVEAFLTSEQGLGLDMAMDQQTRDAMLRALPLIAAEPIGRLRDRRLEAEDFDGLRYGEPVRDLLAWINAPEAFEARCNGDDWATFQEICRRTFKFDPEREGPRGAAELLMQGGGKWDDVWSRFRDAPQLYAGVRDILDEAQPRDLLADPSRRPGVNEEQEDALRTELEALLSLPHGEACGKVATLDEEHKARRGWAWAQLGESPYALALEPLAKLARAATAPLGGASARAMAADYAANGWACDEAAVEALRRTKGVAEHALVSKVVRRLYEPWLDQSARRFQALMSAEALDLGKLASGVSAERECCVLFVDGLRYDVGAALHARLEARGYRARLMHRIAPFPTVTATAKPLASPAHGAVSGVGAEASDFCPVLASNKQPVSAQRLRDAMARQGVEVLEPDESRMTNGDHGGWAEIGKLDEFGHKLNTRLVGHIDHELDAIVDRIEGLLSGGWSKVRVVTDHGWLLLPGGLPKIELPHYLVESRWGRCAAVRSGASPDAPSYPWHWNTLVRIASPPGVACFLTGLEYAHGGVSLQECVVPDLFVERGAETARAEFVEISWRGMRCRVKLETNSKGLRVDLRLNWKQAASSVVASPKDVAENGETSLVVSDEHEGAAASVVALDASNRVLNHKPTTIGEEA